MSDFEYTTPPNPNWRFGEQVESSDEGKAWLAGETNGWSVIDTSKIEPRNLYKLMISGVVPRPVAFVSSVSEEGIENLAPFSWFNTVTHNPPVISISCSNVAGNLKDTSRNIKATKGFTVNIISEPWIHNANACSIDAPSNISEWEISGLTKGETVHVKAPRVKESAFSMECELFQAIDIVHPETGQATTTLILGLVKYIHIRNDVLNESGDLVNPAAFKPIARLGDITYATLAHGFRIPRPSWTAEEGKLKEEGIIPADSRL
ncbi:hypothetical protein ONZ45_g3799 [Pleurotus djamor]|nr:hypothetical protein ONZ45_g3799 [Pleurotus djamor]